MSSSNEWQVFSGGRRGGGAPKMEFPEDAQRAFGGRNRGRGGGPGRHELPESAQRAFGAPSPREDKGAFGAFETKRNHYASAPNAFGGRRGPGTNTVFDETATNAFGKRPVHPSGIPSSAPPPTELQKAMSMKNSLAAHIAHHLDATCEAAQPSREWKQSALFAKSAAPAPAPAPTFEESFPALGSAASSPIKKVPSATFGEPFPALGSSTTPIKKVSSATFGDVLKKSICEEEKLAAEKAAEEARARAKKREEERMMAMAARIRPKFMNSGAGMPYVFNDDHEDETPEHEDDLDNLDMYENRKPKNTFMFDEECDDGCCEDDEATEDEQDY